MAHLFRKTAIEGTSIHVRECEGRRFGLIALGADLDAVAAGYDEAANSDVDAIVVVANTPQPSSFGLDIAAIRAITERGQALRLFRRTQEVLRRFSESTLPTFAVLETDTTGTAFELTLQCHYRVA